MQWRTQDFHLGRAGNAQAKKENKKIKKFKALFKDFPEPCGCDHTRVVTLRSATVSMYRMRVS